jgi:LysM repeat protein
MKIHTVKSGEHLSTIAKRYGCTVGDIKSWNGITTNTVKPGKKLTIYIYGKKPVPKKVVAPVENVSPKETPVENNATVNVSGKYKYYTVQKGDSLYKIAQKNKTTVDEIKRLNNFGAKFSLLPGKKIKVGVI